MIQAVRSMTDSTPDGQARYRRHRRLLRTLVVLLALAVPFGLVTARLFVWPQLPELPLRADAIVELAGPGDRDGAALALAREHRAPVLIQSTVVEEAGTTRCLPPAPDVTIMCFHPDPGTTRGEARYIGALAVQRHWKSVVLVTSRDHAWRARLRVSRCFPGEVYVSMTSLPPVAWLWQIPYQWGATAKALLFQTNC
jgi:uncharacterized SAM-binding protein YcdF (DUF218 family)